MFEFLIVMEKRSSRLTPSGAQFIMPMLSSTRDIVIIHHLEQNNRDLENNESISRSNFQVQKVDAKPGYKYVYIAY